MDSQNASNSLTLTTKVSSSQSHSKINTLPPEVLSQIFHVVRPNLPAKHVHTSFKWVRQITHICTLWRATALSSPSLWTYLPRASFKWTPIYATFLERAKSLNVTCEVDLAGRSSWRVLETHASRISGLVFYAAQPTQLRTFESYLTPYRIPLPNLQSIVIHGWIPISVMNRLFRDEKGYTISPHPNAFTDSLLGELQLKVFNIPAPPNWTSEKMNNLVSLTVHNTGKFDKPSGQDFLNALANMAHTLQYLHLTQDVLPDDLPSHPLQSEIKLPHLTECRLTDTFQTIANFLRHVDIPHTTFLELICQEPASKVSSSLLSEINRWSTGIQHLGLRGIQCTVWNMGNMRQISFDCWPYTTRHSDRPKELVVPDYQPRFSVKLCWVGLGMAPASEIHEAMKDVFHALSIRSVEYLALNSKVEFMENALDGKRFAELLREMDGLRSIYVKGIFLEPFIDALAPASEPDGDATSISDISVPFPQLRYAKLEDDLVYSQTGDISQKVLRYRPVTLVETLEENLFKRLDQEAGIEGLTLKNCYFLIEEDVEILRNLADIVWENTLHLSGMDNDIFPVMRRGDTATDGSGRLALWNIEDWSKPTDVMEDPDLA